MDEPEHPPPAPANPSIEVAATLARGIAAGFRAMPRGIPILLPVLVVSQAALLLGAPNLAFDPNHGPGVSGFDASFSDWLVLGGVVLFNLTFGSWAQCALFIACEAAVEGEPVPDFAHAYARALDRVPTYLGTAILVCGAVLAGTFLCFAPGIWAAAALSTAILRSVVRGEGVQTAIRHSWLLARRRIWRILGAFVFVLGVVLPLVTLSEILQVALTSANGEPANTAARVPFLLISLATGSITTLLVAGMQLALHRRLEEMGPVA